MEAMCPPFFFLLFPSSFSSFFSIARNLGLGKLGKLDESTVECRVPERLSKYFLVAAFRGLDGGVEGGAHVQSSPFQVVY
jgi:hypothetical protein